MKNNGFLVVVILVAITVAGCGARVSYTLGPQIETTEHSEGVRIDGTVLLTGKYGDQLQIKGVTVKILLNETVIKTIQLGTLNQTRPQGNFSLTAPERPDEVRVYYQSVEPRIYRDEGTTYHLEWRPEDQLYAEVDTENPRVTSSVS